MKAILLVATILLSLVGQNLPTQNRPPAPIQGQPPAPPTQNKQGPTLIIEEVIFEGNNVFSGAELSNQLRLVGANVFLRRLGRRNVYTRARFQDDAARLLRFVNERGYLNDGGGEQMGRFIKTVDGARAAGDGPVVRISS